MADLRGKRKYAGPTVAELRKTDERDKRHLSPHQKPHVWTLTVEWVSVTTLRRTRKFTSRAARDESKRRIERELAEKAAKLVKPSKYYRRWLSPKDPFADYGDEEVSVLKEGPRYIETYEEGSTDSGEGKL